MKIVVFLDKNKFSLDWPAGLQYGCHNIWKYAKTFFYAKTKKKRLVMIRIKILFNRTLVLDEITWKMDFNYFTLPSKTALISIVTNILGEEWVLPHYDVSVHASGFTNKFLKF